MICPESGVSKPFRQRRKVLLPEPLRPITAISSPSETLSETPSRTVSDPNDLRTSSATTTGMEPPLEPLAHHAQRPAHGEVKKCDRAEDPEGLECHVVHEGAGPRQLDKADDRRHRGVLDYLHHEADRRYRQPDGLRQHDIDHALRRFQ